MIPLCQMLPFQVIRFATYVEQSQLGRKLKILVNLAVKLS